MNSVDENEPQAGELSVEELKREDPTDVVGGSWTFDREQAERVLGRAAALQLAASDTRMSLTDLSEAAEEAGIDAVLLRQAAREFAPRLATMPSRMGIPTQIVHRRWLKPKLGRAEFERILARLDAFFGALGKRSVGEHAASWTARHIHVTLEHSDGGTAVQISERFVQTTQTLNALGGMIGGIIGTVAGAIGAQGLGLGSAGVVLVVPMVAISSALGLWVARRHLVRITEKARRDFEAALNSIQNVADEFSRALAAAEDDSTSVSDACSTAPEEVHGEVKRVVISKD